VRGYPSRIGSIYVHTFAKPGIPPFAWKTAMLWRADGAPSDHRRGALSERAGAGVVSQRTVNDNYAGDWAAGSRSMSGRRYASSATFTPRDPREAYWFGHDYFEAVHRPAGGDLVDTAFATGRVRRAPPDTQATACCGKNPLDRLRSASTTCGGCGRTWPDWRVDTASPVRARSRAPTSRSIRSDDGLSKVLDGPASAATWSIADVPVTLQLH